MANWIRNHKKLLWVVLPTVCIVAGLAVLLNSMINLNRRYDVAVDKMESGDSIGAYRAFVALDDYKDSAERAKALYKGYVTEQLKQANVGDSVFFGKFEQDNNLKKGPEELEWQVLDIQDGKVLVMSKMAIECQRYNDEYEAITWERCTLRTWLNEDFVDVALTDVEKGMLVTTEVSAEKNPEYDTDPGNDTQDKVFVLSIAEVTHYLPTQEERSCYVTEYADENGAYGNNDGKCCWWLRNPGTNQYGAAYVGSGGVIFNGGYIAYYTNCAVRPAFWLDLNA